MTSPNDSAVLNRIMNPLLPAELDESEKENSADSNAYVEVKTEQYKQLERDGVKSAEAGDYEKSVECFSSLLSQFPSSVSALNNRAQAYRLMGNTDLAMADLDKGIELSEGKGKAACQAYTQRGMIHRLKGNEELCKADFEKASALGSGFAKNQLIMMNPYAAMCNKMIGEMMGKLQRGEPEDLPPPGPPA